MNRRSFLAAAPALLRAADLRSKPHLVLFLADDHGCHDSPVYGGGRDVRTPNLERIAQAGGIYRNTFSGAAICQPSRAILMSGLHSHRNGCIANGRFMQPGVATLPAFLKERGYRIAHFGKSHYIPVENYRDWEFVKSEIPGAALTADLDTKAVDTWLMLHKDDSMPLCLIVNSHSPHVTWEEALDYDPARVTLPPGYVDTPQTRQARTRYYTDVTKMDHQLGEVYDSVRRHLGNNVLFLSTSDNGAQWPFAKWNLYDAGIRLPMVATWPGVIKPGTRNDALLHFADLLPTWLELAGGKPPAGIDGRSFASVLTKNATRHRDDIFASHTADNNGQMNCYPMRALRTARYKYIRNLHPEFAYRTHIDRGVARDGREYWDSWRAVAKTDSRAAAIIRRYHQRPAEELYDLQADPHELKNIASDAKLAKTLADLRQRTNHIMTGMKDEGEVFGVPRPLAEPEQKPLLEGLAG